jgi:tetratricopeptide (TPR) repeat protein
MAFGFGFNKQKTLSSAEKYVQQGKLQNAIAEYEKVLKADPKDLTVSNTVGDLYARLGQNERAVECFKRVGDAYASQGFTVKAIAMYKKLTKIKPTLEGVLRLAELYTQQGLFNDARAQYLHVAEEFLRSGELEQAVRIFQKTLEMDPENVAMRIRLAEVYIRLNKKTEAWQIFASAADNLRAKGQLAATEEILQRMLKLDPGNSYALLLRGRTAFESGDIAAAIQNLEKVADLDTHPEGLRALMQAYLETERFSEAGTLAGKLCTVHNDSDALIRYAGALMKAGKYEEVIQLFHQNGDRLLASDSAKVLETLHNLIGHIREDVPALEALLELLLKAGDATHITEVYELLAHASVQAGDLEKARDYYLKLTQLEPQNQLHAQNYQQVLARLGGAGGTRLITAEEGAVLVDELEATATFIDQRYDDEIALAVRAALTDAELFISYNMPAKALAPLTSALPKAPRDLRLNQRLAALHTRAGRFAEAAVCCRTLEQIYHHAGYPDEATRYGELGEKYEARASASSHAGRAHAAATAPKPVIPELAVVPEGSAAGLFWGKTATSLPPDAGEFAGESAPAVEDEIDISEEWEGQISEVSRAPQKVEAAAAPGKEDGSKLIEETVEEVRFYLSQSMVEQARCVFAKLEKLGAPAQTLAELQREIDATDAMLAYTAPETVEEVSIEEIPADEHSAPIQDGGFQTKFETERDAPRSRDHHPRTTPAIIPTTDPGVREVAQASTKTEHSGVLGDFVSDLEQSLGTDFLPEAPAAHAQPKTIPAPAAAKSDRKVASTASPAPTMMAAAAAATAPAPAPSFTYGPSQKRSLIPEPGVASKGDGGAGIDLADMFGELKQELEEGTPIAQEDPETHYNLGVAFREMGLLDEAIAELQKVCQALDRGGSFPLVMQTYTWLAQCFLDKGVPEAAIRWYDKALKLSTIDEETRVALNYELGSAYESAGNKPAALNHFMQVYGSNIDYRDVAERIQALKS